MNRKPLTMKEVQEGSLEVLKTIDKICKQEHLRYFLIYGTLLGAIRHKGFIPWDDDIDIIMPRPDYEKLIEYFNMHQKELVPFHMFDYRSDPSYPYMIARVSDSRYTLDVFNEKNYGLGLFVDIYPLDGAGNTEEEFTRLKKQANPYASMCFVSTRQTVKRENTKSFAKYLIKFPAFIVAKILGKNFFMKKLEKLGQTYTYDESRYVGVIVWASDDGIKTVYPKDWIGDGTDVEFEGQMFRAPISWDKVLRRGFGNYMELPPEKDRIAHHFYDAYRK